MKFMFHRDRVIASTMGLSIAFKKGVPMEVPTYMIKEIMAAGGVSEAEMTEDEIIATTSTEPTDPALREAALFAVFEKLVLSNVRENFTAGGAPHNAVLAAELGWSIQAKERDLVWAKFKAGTSD